MSSQGGSGNNDESYKLPRPQDEDLMEQAAKASKERRERERREREEREERERQQREETDRQQKEADYQKIMEAAGRDSRNRRG
jgi:micrococcal nuclease